MRIDPTSVFLHTIASLPLRVLLVWIVGTLGAFTPVLIHNGVEVLFLAPLQALFFPFYLLGIAFASGWWLFIAVPLLVLFAWRGFIFVRDEGCALDLLWLYLLPFVITIRTSDKSWPWAALIASALAVFAFSQQLALRQRPT